MPVKFEWQADQEQEWSEEQDITPGGGGLAGAVSLRNHWRIWLALVGLFIVIGSAAYALLNRQADETSHLVSNDVLASHRLVTQTVANRDVDVFTTMLFPFSRDWSTVQVQLLDRQMFWDRTALGLWAAPHLVQAEPQVSLAPDLQTAVVETQMPYIIELSDTVTETVVLLETAVYTQNEGQWQLSPPDDDAFWGQTLTEKDRLLTVSFPAHDTEVSQRLAADLDVILVEFCRLRDANCSPNFHLRLAMETDSAQLLALEEDFRTIFPRRSSGNMLSLTLPAPTLIGLPLDEAGYDALLRGYGGWVTAVLYTEFNRSQQPDYQTISRALAKLDLRPPPLIRERPWQAQIPPPIPLPEQDILTVCQGSQSLSIWRYNLAESAWTDETGAVPADLTPPTWILPFSMPGDDGAALLVNRFNPDSTGQLFLWRAGVVTLLLDDVPGSYWLPSTYVLPGFQGKNVLTFYQRDSGESEQSRFDLLDLNACPGPDCRLQSQDKLVIIAPGATNGLLVDASDFNLPTILLTDGAGNLLHEIETGWSPFWLDAAAFAYIRPDPALDLEFFSNNGGETELVWAGIDDPASPQLVLSSELLRDALPEFGRPIHLGILSAELHPTRPDLWLIQTTTAFNTAVPRQDYWFSYNPQTQAIELLLALEEAQGFPARIEGNGRYLAVMGMESSSPVYFVHDLERQQTHTYPAAFIGPDGIDWSADGSWFVLPGEGMLRLVAPGSRFERPLFHGQEQCGTAVWVNR